MSASAPPLKVNIGWIDSNSKKDAIEYAKGYAVRHFDAPEIGWYAVMSFLGGHLYEVQEGGSGESYLTSVVRSLARGVDPAWFRVGLRAFSVSLRDGRPYCILLPKDDSQKLFALTSNEIQPSGRMNHVVLKGKAMLALGASIFGTGFAFFVGNAGFYVALMAATPEPRNLDQDKLPYRQWSKVERVAPTMFVDSLRYKDGQWAASIKPMQATRASASDPAMPDPKAAGSVTASGPVAAPATPAAPGAPPSARLAPVPYVGTPTPPAARPGQAEATARQPQQPQSLQAGQGGTSTGQSPPTVPARPLIPNAMPVATPLDPTPIRRDVAPAVPATTTASVRPSIQVPSILPSLESANSLAKPASVPPQPSRGAP